jgi:hypothetical protein
MTFEQEVISSFCLVKCNLGMVLCVNNFVDYLIVWNLGPYVAAVFRLMKLSLLLA